MQAKLSDLRIVSGASDVNALLGPFETVQQATNLLSGTLLPTSGTCLELGPQKPPQSLA